MFLGNKKCRIYAACGVSQMPIQLSKNERREIAHVLHNACMIDGAKVNVMSAIDMMVESLKRIILDDSDEKLILPIVLPIESMEGITE